MNRTTATLCFSRGVVVVLQILFLQTTLHAERITTSAMPPAATDPTSRVAAVEVSITELDTELSKLEIQARSVPPPVPDYYPLRKTIAELNAELAKLTDSMATLKAGVALKVRAWA
ncbi:MAG: hypothetical protein WCK89_20450, partial [bacterium]